MKFHFNPLDWAILRLTRTYNQIEAEFQSAEEISVDQNGTHRPPAQSLPLSAG